MTTLLWYELGVIAIIMVLIGQNIIYVCDNYATKYVLRYLHNSIAYIMYCMLAILVIFCPILAFVDNPLMCVLRIVPLYGFIVLMLMKYSNESFLMCRAMQKRLLNDVQAVDIKLELYFRNYVYTLMGIFSLTLEFLVPTVF